MGLTCHNQGSGLWAKVPLLVIETEYETACRPCKTATDTTKKRLHFSVFIYLDLCSGLPPLSPYIVIALISHHLQGKWLKVKLTGRHQRWEMERNFSWDSLRIWVPIWANPKAVKITSFSKLLLFLLLSNFVYLKVQVKLNLFRGIDCSPMSRVRHVSSVMASVIS